MIPNPLLEKLGFHNTDRLVITHADDVGMCHASLQAYAELFAFGLLKSGAVMVPCPWFPAAAALQARHPEYDFGVHLTLTSEWETYRWRPLTAAVSGSSLIDAQGFFPRSDAEVQANALPEEAAAELLAQVQRAQQFGIDPTHIDTHMGAVAHPQIFPAYIDLVRRFRLPALIPRRDVEQLLALGVDAETAPLLAEVAAALEQEGIALMDHVAGLPLDQPSGQLESARRILGNLKPGLTHLLLHPLVDTPEAHTFPDWESRVANYRLFHSDALRQLFEAEGIHLISYRQVRQALRAAPLPTASDLQ